MAEQESSWTPCPTKIIKILGKQPKVTISQLWKLIKATEQTENYLRELLNLGKTGGSVPF